jgi:hypothetical protein
LAEGLENLKYRDLLERQLVRKMIRAFENDKRIATAVILKNGAILQVYPRKEKVENEETWKATWTREGVTFKTEAPHNREAQRLSRAEKVAQKHIKIYCSLDHPEDTPIQVLVRKAYNQEGIDDSIRSTVKDAQAAYYGMRRDPGLYVLLPENGRIEPVYFNRKSGFVLFGNRDQTNESAEGLKFYRKLGVSLIPVQINTQTQAPDQKAIVICRGFENRYYSSVLKTQELRAAGYFIYTYHYRWSPSAEVIKEIYKVIPNCQGIFWSMYDSETLSYFDQTSKPWVCKRLNFKKWIAEHK